jgi:outer membrane protein OmpA-like peptidoglycan-associated protein
LLGFSHKQYVLKFFWEIVSMIQHRKHKLTAAILLTSQLSYAQSIIAIPNLSDGGSGSILSPVTAPIGQSLMPTINTLDITLDPLTNPIDAQIGVPLIDVASPVTTPVLKGLEPIVSPVDGLLHDISGGSLSDALTNSDQNTDDGNGIANDLLGGGKNRDKTQSSSTALRTGNPAEGNNGNDKPVGNAQGKKPKNKSPIESVSAPLGRSLTPLIDTVDESLDPITNVIDKQAAEPILSAAAPAIDPLLDALTPITHPVDGIVSDLSGVSLEDALTTQDYNDEDGQGPVNDLLGNGRTQNSGREAGESSPLPIVTRPLGEALDTPITDLDKSLAPLTDQIDGQLIAPILDAVAPVTTPILSAIEPATDPVDGSLADITGGSVEDALTNTDDNTTDGDGLVNDLLGGGRNTPAPAPAPSSGSPLAAVTVPLGEALVPVIDALDTGLDPVTDTVDSEVGVPLLDALAPVTEPVIDGAEPIITPVDAIVNELTGGSVSDALTNSDANTADGDGLVNDLLGGGSAAPAPAPSDGSPLAPVTVPLGEALEPVIDALDTGLDPVTDTVDSEVGVPLLDALAPVTEPVITGAEPIITPVDAIVRELTGGSVSDALTNSDANTDDGDGVVNDLLGNRNANSGSSNPNPNDSDNDGIDDGASGEFNVVARQDQAGLTQSALDLAIATAATGEQCVDQDADGVCDQKDRCENTPKTSLVLEDGCDLGNIEPARLKGVNFSFDDDSLSPKAKATLDEAISLLQRSEYKTIEINGHTDHFGKQDYNLRLSQRRASNVKDYLIEHGIDANRIKIVGRGDQSLIAKIEDKDQAELNRRVDFTIIK